MKFKVTLTTAAVMVVGALMLVAGFVLFRDQGYFQNIAILSFIVMASPLIIANYLEYRRIKQIERYLPDFLRDVAESKKSGMPLIKAIETATRTSYGPLTKEMVTVSNQLSWGIPLEDALKKFMNRVDSKLVKQAVLIIMESYKSGGEITSILETVSVDIQTLKEMETERKSKLKVYTYSIYMIFLLFLGIIIVLSVTFVPATPELANVSKLMGGGGAEHPSESEFITFFYHLTLIQAIFAGLISGQMGEGSAISGIKHSMALIIITMVSFSLFISQVPFEAKLANEIVRSPPGTETSMYVTKTYVMTRDVTSIQVVEAVNRAASSPEIFAGLTPEHIFFRAENCKPCIRNDIVITESGIKVNRNTNVDYYVKHKGDIYTITIGGS